MDDEAPAVDRTALDDLLDLAKIKGKVGPKALEARLSLAQMIFDTIEVQGTVSDDCRGVVLWDVLLSVVASARESVIGRLGTAAKWEDDPQFQTAAAAELLGMPDGPEFERVLEQYCRNKAGSEADLKDLRESLRTQLRDFGDARRRQLRAAVWVLQSDRNIRRPRLAESLYLAFIYAIKVHLADNDVREQLKTIAARYMEPAASSGTVASDQTDAVSSASAWLSAAIQRIVHQSYQVIDPQLQRVENFSMAVRNQLQGQRGYHAKSDLLPVRWTTAPQYYFDHWENIRGDGQAEPIPLANKFDRIAEVFESIPSGRLVVLGQGGAGKTTLAVELALTLLSPDHRSRDEPVPFIFNLASWNPSEQQLTEWMVDQLIVNYPALKATTKGKGTHAAQLVRGDYILPIFDGFDELAASLRAVAIEQINGWRRCDGKLVVTSRPQEYLDTINKSHIRLSRAPVVALENLTFDDIGDYLRLSTPPAEQGDPSWTKWSPVLKHLRSEGHDTHSERLLDVLSIPLMVFLARSIYRHPLANPMELLDVARFSNTATIEAHLLDEFVRVVYKHSPQDDELEEDSKQHKLKSYQPGDAQQWLGFLATVLVAQRTTDFAWWKENTRMVDAPLGRLIGILATGGFPVLATLFMAIVGNPGILRTANEVLMSVSVSCLVISVMLIVSSKQEPRVLSLRPGMPTKDRMPSYWGGIYFTRVFTVISIMLVSIVNSLLIFPASFLLLAILFFSSPPSLTDFSTPQSLLRSDRTVAIIRGGIFGVCMSTVCIVLWLVDGDTRMLQGVPIIVSISCLLMLPAASVAWFICRIGLAMSGRLPWHCMHFLNDAHRRGVLRQSGGVYQFRHAFLQIRLATLYVNGNKSRLDSVEDLESELIALQFKSGRLDAASAISELRDAIESHGRAKNKYRVVRTSILLIDVLRSSGDTVEALRELRLLRESEMDERFDLHYANRRMLVELLLEQGDLDEAWVEYWQLLRLLEEDRRSHYSSTASRAERILSELRERPLFEYEEDDQD